MKRDDFDMMLKKNIPELQEYEPNENLWESISSSLDFEAALEKNKPNLTSYSPDESLWSKIETGLEQEQNHRTRIIRYLRIPVSIAASVLLVVTFYFAFNKSNVTLSHTEEVAIEWQINPEANETINAINPEKFIQETCQKHNFICETEEFREKSELLNELNQNLERINAEINSYGTSVPLEKSKIKVENLKAQVVKELIKQILS